MFELPDMEALFMPSNMDGSQMAFKFKEVPGLQSLSTFSTVDSKLLPLIFDCGGCFKGDSADLSLHS